MSDPRPDLRAYRAEHYYTHCHHGREIACLECVQEARQEDAVVTPRAADTGSAVPEIRCEHCEKVIVRVMDILGVDRENAITFLTECDRRGGWRSIEQPVIDALRAEITRLRAELERMNGTVDGGSPIDKESPSSDGFKATHQPSTVEVALRLALVYVHSAQRASHLMDGFTLGDDGLPRSNVYRTQADADLEQIEEALETLKGSQG